MFLELTYHLEHHLYPQVPSHRPGRAGPPARPVLRRGRRPAAAGSSEEAPRPRPGQRVLRRRRRAPWPRATGGRPPGPSPRPAGSRPASSTTTSPTWTTCSSRRRSSPATARLARYRAETQGVDQRRRTLAAAARASTTRTAPRATSPRYRNWSPPPRLTRLAEQVRVETARWQDFAEEVISTSSRARRSPRWYRCPRSPRRRSRPTSAWRCSPTWTQGHRPRADVPRRRPPRPAHRLPERRPVVGLHIGNPTALVLT